MNARAALLDKWRTVLVFRIGDSGSWSASQLPDVRQFPQRFPISPESDDGRMCVGDQSSAAWMLAAVLAVAALKLHRSDGEPEQPYAGDYTFFLASICEGLRAVRLTLPYGQDLWQSYLGALGTVLELAMLSPELVSALHVRLDALTNAELHRMAVDAVQALGSQDALADLLASWEVS